MPKAENVGLSRDFAHSVGCELGDDEQLLKCLQGVNSSAFQQSAPQGSLFPMVDGLQFERWPADLFAHGLFADVPRSQACDPLAEAHVLGLRHERALA